MHAGGLQLASLRHLVCLSLFLHFLRALGPACSQDVMTDFKSMYLDVGSWAGNWIDRYVAQSVLGR